MYTPKTTTEEELLELGFEKSDIWYKTIFYRDGKTEKCDIHYDEATPEFYISMHGYSDAFYPQNKEQLEGFISIFQPK